MLNFFVSVYIARVWRSTFHISSYQTRPISVGFASAKYRHLFVPHKRKALCRYNDIIIMMDVIKTKYHLVIRSSYIFIKTFYLVITIYSGCRYNNILSRYKHIRWAPVRARGIKSRMCPPYPQRDRKRRLNGAVCRNHRIKRVVPCRC